MKKITLYTILSCTILCLFSACGDKQNTVADAHIYGTIENPRADHINLSFGDYSQKVMLDTVHSFDLKLNRQAGYYTFRHGRETAQIYLKPGDDMKISLNAKNFDESLKFEGTGAVENNYLTEKYLKMESYSSKSKDNYSADEATYIEKINAHQNELNQLLASSDVDPEFAKAEAKNIEYEIVINKMLYERAHRYFSGNNDFNASAEFKEAFDKIDYKNETEYNLIPAYREMANNYFLEGELEESIGKLKETSSTVIKDNVIKDLTKWLSPGTAELKSVVADMKSLTTDSTLIAKLESKFQEMKDLQRGKESPGFDFASIEGGQVKLADLKGKNVYIDVWATWCGPCKREIPHLKELEAAYHDKNIEFVSISVDVPKDEGKWKDMVKEKDLKGVQLISDNGWDTDFVEQYLIKGIPRFILLDETGKIVSADAPRPSSGDKIKDMIESLSI